MAINGSESTKATAFEFLNYGFSNKATDIQIASVKASAFSLQGVPCAAHDFPCRPPWRDCKVLRYQGASTVRVKVYVIVYLHY